MTGRRGTERNKLRIGEKRILVLAGAVFGSLTEATHWLAEPNPSLNGLPPADLLSTKKGQTEVEGLLHRIEHGIFM